MTVTRLKRAQEPDDPRTPEQVIQHYEVERGLAGQLRLANAAERQTLYRAVYDELFRRVPHHPQLIRQDFSEAATRARTGWQVALLEKFTGPETVLLEVGAGDCAVTLQMCRRVKLGCAADVSRILPDSTPVPENFRLTIFDGLTLPLPAGSVDVAYSNQLMEHLHPDDAEAQLRSIHAALRPGGSYLCITPNHIGGPWDVSEYFDDAATGLHLKEYTFGELAALMRRVGFRRVQPLVGGRGRYWRFPMWPLLALERIMSWLPTELRFRMARRKVLRFFLGIRLVATK
jgi:SAM-dependent methyltransferase